MNNYTQHKLFLFLFLSLFVRALYSQTDLEYATYYGGSDDEEFSAVAIGPDGTSYFFGKSKSTDFPTTSGAAQRYNAGGWDATLIAVGDDGVPKWSTFIGTSDDEDHANGLDITADGRFLYLSFTTTSAHLPICPSAWLDFGSLLPVSKWWWQRCGSCQG